jgi:hypothetical protein
VEKVLKQVREQYNHVHGVANCIGDASIMKPIHITSEVTCLLRVSRHATWWCTLSRLRQGCAWSAQDEYDHTMRTNVKTAFNILKVRLRGLRLMLVC